MVLCSQRVRAERNRKSIDTVWQRQVRCWSAHRSVAVINSRIPDMAALEALACFLHTSENVSARRDDASLSRMRSAIQSERPQRIMVCVERQGLWPPSILGSDVIKSTRSQPASGRKVRLLPHELLDASSVSQSRPPTVGQRPSETRVRRGIL